MGNCSICVRLDVYTLAKNGTTWKATLMTNDTMRENILNQYQRIVQNQREEDDTLEILFA